MIEKVFVVANELGIHARVASKITRCCKAFSCSIVVIKDSEVHNIKNVLSVMTINAKFGEPVLVQFDGEDEAEAAVAVEKLFADKFGEK